VVWDSPGGATLCNKMSELTHYKHVQYTLLCANTHIIIFGIFLDSRENAEWSRFFGPPCINVVSGNVSFDDSLKLLGVTHWCSIVVRQTCFKHISYTRVAHRWHSSVNSWLAAGLLVRECSAIATLIVSRRVCLWVCHSVCPRFQNASSAAVLAGISWYFNAMFSYVDCLSDPHG